MIPASAPQTILLVEDDQAFYDVLSDRLSGDGYVVRLATDGEEALRELRVNKPDLLVIDLILPKKSGVDVMRAMRAQERTARIPIVVLASRAHRDDAAMLAPFGILDYLDKSELLLHEIESRIVHALKKA